MRILLNEAMIIERSQALNAGHYERNEKRQGHANGFKPKSLQTRLGRIELRVPQTRDSSFYPSCLEKGLRSERALNCAMAEMYVQGVSTRKVTKVLEEICRRCLWFERLDGRERPGEAHRLRPAGAKWKKLRTSNMEKSQNKELKKRTCLIRVFPNKESLLRIASAILMELDEEWLSADNRHMKM